MKKSWRAVEHLAKFEQRNAMKKGKFISMIHTHTIKSLSEEEKKEFFGYMKRKGGIGKFLMLSVFASLIAAFLVRPGITGNVIFGSENVSNYFSILFAIVFIVLFVLFIIWRTNEKKVEKKLRRYVEIAEKAIR